MNALPALKIATTSSWCLSLLLACFASAEDCSPQLITKSRLGGSEIYKLTQERLFNSHIHKLVLTVHEETESKVLADAAKDDPRMGHSRRSASIKTSMMSTLSAASSMPPTAFAAIRLTSV